MLVKLLKKIITYLLFSILIMVILAYVKNVSTEVSYIDAETFQKYYKLEQPKQSLTFDQQIKLIKKVQLKVLEISPIGNPIPEYQNREPQDLIKNRTGLCFDRSRTLDKVYSWLGFQTRHVFIFFLDKEKNANYLAALFFILKSGVSTHAVTEVKTEKGWIIVDSTSDWLSVTKYGKPVIPEDIIHNIKDFDNLPLYFNDPLIAIRGLYSRRGQFYEPFVPFPDLNWTDFLEWVFEN